ADKRCADDAACHARLISDDDDGEIGAIEEPHRVDAVRIKHEPLQAIEVTGFFDQGAIAVEEYCRTHTHPVTKSANHKSPNRQMSRHRLRDILDLNPFHAAVIDRTLVQHAGATEHLPQ